MEVAAGSVAVAGWPGPGLIPLFPEKGRVMTTNNLQNRAPTLAASLMVSVMVLASGCCAVCHHHPPLARPGAIYGEEFQSGYYHPGPLSGLVRLLGIGRGYPCADCGPRYWGDWGGERAGCEPCDDYGQWVGSQSVPGGYIRTVPSSLQSHQECEECQRQGMVPSAQTEILAEEQPTMRERVAKPSDAIVRSQRQPVASAPRVTTATGRGVTTQR